MATQSRDYLSQAFGLLRRDKGWMKVLLVMGIAQFVPFVGIIGTRGYALEWGRLTAWGVDSSPKQKDVDVGGCLLTGFKAFVVELCYGLAMFVVGIVIGMCFGLLGSGMSDAGATAMAWLGDALARLLGTFIGFVLVLATLRTAIYQTIGAGLRVGRVFEMIKRDFGGFCVVILWNLLLGIIIGFVTGIIAVISLMLFAFAAAAAIPTNLLGAAADGGITSAEWTQLMGGIGSVLVVLLPVIVAIIYVLCVLGALSQLMSTTTIALWVRQFDVPRWGRSEDPLPVAGGFGSVAGGGTGAAAVGYADPVEAVAQEPETTVLPEAEPTAAAPQAEPEVAAPEPAAEPEVAAPESSASQATVEPVAAPEPAALEPVAAPEPVVPQAEGDPTAAPEGQDPVQGTDQQ